jgi:hypothetical protein
MRHPPLPSARKTIALTCLLGASVGALPALAWTEFTGGGYVTGFSEECGSGGWQGTNRILARMAPAGLQFNHVEWTLLSFFHGSYAQNFVLPANIGDSFVTVDFAGIGFGLHHPAPVTRVRFLTALSDTPTQESGLVTLFGEFENFNDHIGCTAQFGVTMHRTND